MKIGTETCVGMRPNDAIKSHWCHPLHNKPVDYDYLLIQSSIKKGPGQ